MFEKFTERARKVMTLARHDAQRRNSEFIGTEHILMGLIHEGEGSANKMLKVLGVSPEAVSAEVDRVLADNGLIQPPREYQGQIPFSPRSKRVIELSGESASQLGSDVVGTEHLLIALRKENEGIASQVLENLRVSLAAILQAREQVLPSEPELNPSRVRSIVAKYGRTGPSFKTPNGTLLTISELIAVVEAQIISPADARKLIWGEETKS